MKTVLVTGGAGYIGSHAVVELLSQGFNVVAIDSLENGYLELLDKRAKFYKGNIQDINLLERVFIENNIDIVMHFADYIKVPESIENPNKYYKNSICSLICLLETMRRYRANKIIFSSTAAVYGEINTNCKITEEYPTNPINPYGKSKLMAESIIIDNAKAYGIQYAIFRYFNVAGAHPNYKLGQKDKSCTSIIPKLLNSVSSKHFVFSIFGNDYDTRDGTCIRDFIHVVDLVKAHICAVSFLEEKQSGIFNLGSEKGYSVLEVLMTFSNILGEKIPYQIEPKREGDPSNIVASSEKANQLLHWKAKWNLIKILEHSWNWEKANQ